jgi:hypothetical protein
MKLRTPKKQQMADLRNPEETTIHHSEQMSGQVSIFYHVILNLKNFGGKLCFLWKFQKKLTLHPFPTYQHLNPTASCSLFVAYCPWSPSCLVLTLYSPITVSLHVSFSSCSLYNVLISLFSKPAPPVMPLKSPKKLPGEVTLMSLTPSGDVNPEPIAVTQAEMNALKIGDDFIMHTHSRGRSRASASPSASLEDR